MLRKIKTSYHQISWQSLRDWHNIGLFVFLIIVLLVSWSGVKAIQTNYQLQKQVATLQQQNKVDQLKNSNQQLQNDYYNTNQYLELSARQSFGLGQPGETELLVPKNVALAHLAPIANSTAYSKTTTQRPWYERNFQAWLNFFLHRQPSSD